MLLTGIHLMRSGEVEANLVRLNETAKLPSVTDLIARRTGGIEKATLSGADLDFHRLEYERLRAELQSAYESSALSEVSRGTAKLNDVLVRVRLKQQICP